MAIGDLTDRVLPPDEKDLESVLVLAGDISSIVEQLKKFLDHVRPRFRSVIYIPGNHEFYHDSMEYWETQLSSVDVLCPLNDVKTYKIDYVTFVAGTLWGECSAQWHMNHQIRGAINDFRLIQKDECILTPEEMRNMAFAHKQKIRDALSIIGGPVVVVTHHLPSWELVSERFRGSALNGAFVCDCADLISMYSPNVWLFGHTHDTIDTTLGETRFVSNPMGYRTEWGGKFNTYNKKFITL